MINYWLLKTEPSTYSYTDLERDKRTVWDGVTNPLARKHLRSMKKGDLVLIYHTGEEKQVVGIAEVLTDPYPDPNKKDPRFVVVDLKPRRRLQREVLLAEIKKRREFTEPDESGDVFALVRIGRLSVVPVSKSRWQRLCELGQVTT